MNRCVCEIHSLHGPGGRSFHWWGLDRRPESAQAPAHADSAQVPHQDPRARRGKRGIDARMSRREVRKENLSRTGVVSAPNAGPKWNRRTTPVVSYRTAINTSRNSYKMGLREFLSIPKLRSRTKSKARSEIGLIEGPSTVDPPEPRLTGSTPDLRIGSSASATQSPLTSPDQGSEGT